MANKKRLIDANALLETGSGIKMTVPVNFHPYEAIRIQGNVFRKAVEEAPTVDAEEVVHGHWRYYSTTMQECSNCQRHTARHRFKYWIICGGVSTMSVVGFAHNGKKVHAYDLRNHKKVWYEYDSEVGYYPLTTVTHWMPLPEPPKGE